jgi:fructose-specific phosphotransferase system component IIB
MMRAPIINTDYSTYIHIYHPPTHTKMPAKLALIGSGVFAEAAYLPALSAITKDVTLHTIWSRSAKSAEKLHSAAQSLSTDIQLEHGEDGLQRVLENKEIEGVMIVLPITAQPDIVIKCLEAGKHVLSEKPIGKDVATAKKLVEEYEKRFASKGLIWRVAESKWSPVGREYGTNTDCQIGSLSRCSLSRGTL